VRLKKRTTSYFIEENQQRKKTKSTGCAYEEKNDVGFLSIIKQHRGENVRFTKIN
jgi:hypothetical protein